MIKLFPLMSMRNLVLAFLFILPLAAKSQCSASFTYTAAGNSLTFDATVTPAPSASVSYYWWFSDNGNYSAVEDPTYTFSGSGVYMVCFSVYDFNTSCSDSLCQMITVGNPTSCTADFTWVDTLGYTYFTSTSTAGAGAQYMWDFGDGFYDNQQNPTHSYASAGVYTACLYVYDSLQNFCDSACHTITVAGNGCSADFVWIDTMGYTYFTSYTSTGPGAFYIWDFGDGDYSNAVNPSHQYAFGGYFLVCLTVYDSLQNYCDSVCHLIFATPVSGIAESVMQGSLTASPNPSDQSMMLSFIAGNTGMASVSMFDAAGRIVTEQSVPVQKAGTVNTEINTGSMPQGIYLVKVQVNETVAWKRIAVTHQ
jgi:PKD repeat protein